MRADADQPGVGQPAGEPPAGAGPVGRGWRESLVAAADFALLGIAVTIAALPIVTLGAALATGSAAVDHWLRHGGLPPVRQLAAGFGRAVLPGLGAGVAAAAVAGLLALDLAGIRRGGVPGGTPLLALSVVVAVQLAGLAALTLVGAGRYPDRSGRLPGSWLAAARWAGRTGYARPLLPTALAGVLAVAVVLGALVPVTAPVLLGFLLFALHVVTGRMGG